MVRVRTANALSEMASGFDSLSLRQDLEANPIGLGRAV